MPIPRLKPPSLLAREGLVFFCDHVPADAYYLQAKAFLKLCDIFLLKFVKASNIIKQADLLMNSLTYIKAALSLCFFIQHSNNAFVVVTPAKIERLRAASQMVFFSVAVKLAHAQAKLKRVVDEHEALMRFMTEHELHKENKGGTMSNATNLYKKIKQQCCVENLGYELALILASVLPANAF